MEKSKFLKRLFGGVGLIFTAMMISGCTKSFCSINDTACMYATYVDENKTAIDTNATSKGYLLPGDAYWSFIDAKVEAAFNEVRAAGLAVQAAGADDYTNSYVPASYLESNIKYQTATAEEKLSLANDETIRAIIRYAGYNDDKVETLWGNFDKWTEEANETATVKNYVPTTAYLTYYKSAISTGVGSAVTCITPTSGYFGINENTYIEGKTWGQAFSQYGFIEGLLVYPIGWLVYQFAVAFGASGANATGQILSIFLVTLIVRFFIVLASIGSTNSQNKMNDVQGEVALIKAKYPNADTNRYEQSQMTQETMALYKKRGIHPFKQILVLIVQFPIFIAVWGALQGSAILTKGEVFGLSLATTTMAGMQAHNPTAIILFILMAVAQFFAAMIPTWITNYHKKKIVGAATVKVNDQSSTAMMMKYMPIIMTVVIIFMGLNLAAAMGIYWFFGAIISILQAIITEIVNMHKKNHSHGSTGGSDAYGRSGSFKDVKAKKSKHMNLR